MRRAGFASIPGQDHFHLVAQLLDCPAQGSDHIAQAPNFADGRHLHRHMHHVQPWRSQLHPHRENYRDPLSSLHLSPLCFSNAKQHYGMHTIITMLYTQFPTLFGTCMVQDEVGQPHLRSFHRKMIVQAAPVVIDTLALRDIAHDKVDGVGVLGDCHSRKKVRPIFSRRSHLQGAKLLDVCPPIPATLPVSTSDMNAGKMIKQWILDDTASGIRAICGFHAWSWKKPCKLTPLAGAAGKCTMDQVDT